MTCETAFVITAPCWSDKPAAMNWLNNATTWSMLGGLLGGALLSWGVSFAVNIGGSLTLTLIEGEVVAVSPLVVFDAATVNVFTTDPLPLNEDVRVRSVMEAPGVLEVIVIGLYRQRVEQRLRLL